MKKPVLIAEIGINHNGSIDIAHEMIKVASSYCKCDYVKFQKRTVKELLSTEEYNKPHPNPDNAFGETYGVHREFLEFDIEQHRQLQLWCKEQEIGYACSVWDLTAAKEICSLNPDYIKVPSASNLDFEILRYLCNNFPNDIHVSLGMTTEDQIFSIIDLFQKHNRQHSLILYACTSSYPCVFENICLNELKRLNHIIEIEKRFKSIGFSGHHLGISVDIAAMMMGVSYIERHFTLDRSQKGSDHSASLEPDQLRKLSRDLQNVSKSLTYKEKGILDCELSSYKKMKRNKPI